MQETVQMEKEEVLVSKAVGEPLSGAPMENSC